MRLLRNKFLSKFLAVFMLVTIFESTIHATVSLALTGGAHQPEYTSYEESGATDMVNLLTGDFNFSLPILEVPGPDGSFSLPLTYNAGIGPDQEASWVGLGWTLNVGSITRGIVQYPDDASGEVQSVTNKDLVGVRGWTSNALGFGQIGWNTQVGHYGSISLLGLLSFSWDNKGLSSIGSAGWQVSTSGAGISFDASQFMEAAFTVATMGIGTAAKIGTQLAISIGTSVALSFVAGNQTPNAPTDGYWEYSKRTSSGFLGMWEDYWIWLDQTRYEQMYGVLNLDKATLSVASPTGVFLPEKTPVSIGVQVNGVAQPLYEFAKSGNSQGAGSDVSYNIPSGTEYQDVTSPVVLATDNYSVKGPGISGNIKPYRFEIGSVSMPRQMSQYHSRLATVTHLPYKVPFIYEGSSANSYFQHVGSATSVSSPTFYYGLTASPATNNLTANGSLTYNLNDVIFQSPMRQDVATTKKLPMANHVEWLSNNEIVTTPNEFPNGFMDYFSGTDRAQFRQLFNFGPQRYFYTSSNDFTNGRVYLSSQDLTNFQVGNSVNVGIRAYDPGYDWGTGTGTVNNYSITGNVQSVSSSYFTIDITSLLSSIGGKYCDITVSSGYPKRTNSIGGYSITGVNGMTYHYALPSYEYSNYTQTQVKDFPTTKYTEVKRDEPFANTWLLTGITGSDFVDRGGTGNAANGVIDANDWGHWIKFNYGKYADNYQWRIPYSGTTISSDNKSLTYSNGSRQTYYLNSIETRTHVALFVKDIRNDNRGINASSGAINDGKSLRLSEIELMTQNDYRKLFAPASQGGFALPTDAGLANLTKCWMMSDFFSPSGTGHPPQGNFIIQNSIKRVKLEHGYDLCPGILNSANSGGKLTLKSVSLLGKNDSRLVPSYKFDYGSNPSYSPDKWDGWGMYNAAATSAFDTHQASPSDLDGSAWSLTRITNPLGSTIEIAYERDRYSSISGKRRYGSTSNYSNGTSNEFYSGGSSCGTLKVPNASLFQVGEVLQLDGICGYSGYGNFPPYYQLGNGSVNGQSYSGEYTLQAIDNTNNLISFGANFRNINYVLSGNYVTINSDGGTIKKVVNSQPGGNLRVASLTLNDNDKQYKTRYLYNLDNGMSSGTVAREPEYVKLQDYGFYSLPGYPFTPVMYSKVTVLTGNLTTDADFHTKQVYEFEVPDANMIYNTGVSDFNFTTIASRQFAPGRYYNSYYKAIRNEIYDNTAKIGKLKSTKTYDKTNALVSSSSMIYSNSITNRNPSTGNTENNYQGVFTEGTLMYDRVVVAGGSNNNTDYDYNKMARTTIIKYPYELTRVINSKDGFTSETENKVWDLTTGIVTEKTQKSALGVTTRSVTKLAHTVPAYAEMGSKALNSSNKNMLGHEAANYSYLLDANGNSIGLLSASVTTWKNGWGNYRFLSGSNYVEGQEGQFVWRKYQNFTFKGSYSDLQSNGSIAFSPSKEFSFVNGATNNGWLKTSEVTRYDHYSAAIEGKDLNGIFSSGKKDITAQQYYASATNANYFEFAYSGGEDWLASGSGLYLGGEVAKGSGSPVYKTATGNETHTGQVAVQLAANQKSFTYKPASLQAGRTYRASAWTNSLNGAIYYSVNGSAEQIALPTSGNSVNGWYQINVQIPIANFTSLEVGVKSTNGTVSFDDFRFQPLDASVTASVYDPSTGALTHSLDNQNMFTKYEYNDKGQLTKTYSESFTYGVKLISEKKDNYKRFTTNP